MRSNTHSVKPVFRAFASAGAVAAAAMLAGFISVAPTSAHGAPNVFDDAVFWFRGGKDLNGDRCMQQGEFFDDLHADDATLANHKMSMVDYTKAYEGFEGNAFRGNATFRDEQVVFPALGTNIVKNMQVLRISNGRKQSSTDSQYKYHPFVVNPRSVFANNHISNEYTIVSRIRLDDDGVNRNVCFVRVGYNSSNKQGMWLGFLKSHPSHPGCMRVAAYRTPSSGGADTAWTSSLPVPTNTWVDLAIMVGNGMLRVGVAAPVSLSSHNNNPTIAFDGTSMWTDNCPVTSDGYRLFCLNGQTAPAAQGGADTTCFIGSVQQLAIWGRTLSDQEVMAAFGMPRPALFRTGFDNDASNEFGGTRSGSSQEIDGLGSWQDVWNEMWAGDVWTNKFTALRDENGLPQIFSIKSLPTSSSADIEVVLNEEPLGTYHVAKNAHVFWPVGAGIVTAGANTLVIRRTDRGAGRFRLDAMELGGSLGVGTETASSTDDGRVHPARIKTGVPSAADPNTQHWPMGLMPSTGVTNLHFRVWVDPEVAGKSSFTFRTATKYNGTSAGDFFSIYINDVYQAKLSAQNGWKLQTLPLMPADVHGGWNDFELKCADTLTCYWDFGYYRFETVLPSAFGFSPPPGMSVIVR